MHAHVLIFTTPSHVTVVHHFPAKWGFQLPRILATVRVCLWVYSVSPQTRKMLWSLGKKMRFYDRGGKNQNKIKSIKRLNKIWSGTTVLQLFLQRIMNKHRFVCLLIPNMRIKSLQSSLPICLCIFDMHKCGTTPESKSTSVPRSSFLFSNARAHQTD